VYNGSSVADVLVQHKTESTDVLVVAVCLVANLAVDEVSQVQVCSLIKTQYTPQTLSCVGGVY